MKKLLLMSLMLLCLVSFASAQLTTDNIAYWAFDEGNGTNAEDSSGNNNDGTLSSSSMWTTDAKLGDYAISIGDEDNVDTGGFSDLAEGDFSINYWFNVDNVESSTSNQFVYGMRTSSGTASGNGFASFIARSGHGSRPNHIDFLVRKGGTLTAVDSQDPYTSFSGYIMVTVTKESNTLTMYIDGTQVDTNTITGTGGMTGSTNLLVGSTTSASGSWGGINIIDADIDEFGLWDRALSPTEIGELYNNGQGLNPYAPQEPGIYIRTFDFFTGSPTSDIEVFYDSSPNPFSFINQSGNFVYINFPDGSYDFTISSTGYVSVNDTINHVNVTERNYNLIPSSNAPLQMRIRDTNTGNLITQTVNITVQSDTNQFTNQTSTGNITFQPVFNIGDSYTIILDSLGAINYSEATYDIVYTENLAINGIDLFMTPFVLDGEFITFVAQRPDLTLIQNALVTVERFVDGQYQVIGQKNTDIIGEAVFFLEPGKTHKITVQREGFVTQVFITTLSQTVYSVILPFASDFNYDAGYAGISHDYQPRTSVLLPQTQQFNFTVSAQLENLQYMQVFLRDPDGNVITSEFSNNPAGTQLTLNADLTAYNNSFVTLDRRFKVIGFPEQRFTNNYNVNELEKFTGTIQELRTFLMTDPDVTLAFRISLFAVFFIISMIVLATILTGVPNLLISLSIGLLAAYVVGVNFYIIAVIFLVLGLLIFAISFREATT